MCASNTAAVGGPWDCAGGRGAKHAVGEHRLAADIAAGEVRLGTEPHVDRLQLQAVGRGACRAIERLGRFQTPGLASRRDLDLPRLRHPLRQQVERLDPRVGEPDLVELRLQPVGARGVRPGPDDASPELGIDLVAMAPGDLGLLDDPAMQAPPVDGPVPLGPRWKRPPQQRIFGGLWDRFRRQVIGGARAGHARQDQRREQRRRCPAPAEPTLTVGAAPHDSPLSLRRRAEWHRGPGGRGPDRSGRSRLTRTVPRSRPGLNTRIPVGRRAGGKRADRGGDIVPVAPALQEERTIPSLSHLTWIQDHA